MKQRVLNILEQRAFPKAAAGRVYVEDPSEAPEGVQVREGERGGLWYPSGEVEGEETTGDDEGEGETPDPVTWDRPDAEELNEYVQEVQETEWWGAGHEAFLKSWEEGENTQNEYSEETDEGRVWDEGRAQQHEEWAEDLLNPDARVDPESDEDPVAVVLLGPPGAGKGWWQEKVEEGAYGESFDREFTHISSDETKEPIPEYDGENASYVHDEASHIAKEYLAPKALEQNHNVILDKVAGSESSVESTKQLVENMQDKGYDIRATFIDVPEEKSAYNVVQRYHDEGRFTPLDYTVNAKENSWNTFQAVADELPDDKVGVFNNDVEWGNPPEPMEVGDDLFKQFMRRLVRKQGYELLTTYTDLRRFIGGDNEHPRDGGTRKAAARRERGRSAGVDGRALRLGDGGGDRGPQRVDIGKLADIAESILKERVDISSPDEAPEGVNVEEGERGGYYYETGNDTPSPEGAGASMPQLRELETELVEEFGPQIAHTVLRTLGETLTTVDPAALTTLLGMSEKGRVYVESPEDAPEGVSVQEGEEGGTYYVTGGGEGGEDDSADGIDAGDEITIDNFGIEQDVTVVETGLPNNALLVEDEDGDEFVVNMTEVVGEEGGSIVDDIMSDFEDLMTEEPEEEEEDEFEGQPYDSEEERQEFLEDLREENLQEVDYYELPEPDEGPVEGTGVSRDEVMNTEPNDFGVRAEEEDVDTLVETIESGSLGQELGVNVELSEIPEDSPFGQSDFGRPNREDPAVDVAIDTEDFLNLEFALQHEHFGSEYDSEEEHRRHWFGHVRTDDIQEYAETLQEDPGEMDYPALFLRNDGSVGDYQEGRHRALAAWVAGVDEIPVRIILDADKDPKSKMISRAMQKVVSWLPLASESPDPYAERVDAEYNEVEDEENLPTKDKILNRLG